MPISPLDTYDYTPLEVDLGRMLAEGEVLSAVEVAVPLEAQAAGVEVDEVVNLPSIVKGYSTQKTAAAVRFWPLVVSEAQEESPFGGNGLTVAFGIRVTTSLGRRLERHLPVTFVKALSVKEA